MNDEKRLSKRKAINPNPVQMYMKIRRILDLQHSHLNSNSNTSLQVSECSSWRPTKSVKARKESLRNEGKYAHQCEIFQSDNRPVISLTTTFIAQTLRTTLEYITASNWMLTPTDGNRCTEYELGGERATEEDARRVVKQRHAQYQRPGAPRHEVVEAPRNVM